MYIEIAIFIHSYKMMSYHDSVRENGLVVTHMLNIPPPHRPLPILWCFVKRVISMFLFSSILVIVILEMKRNKPKVP